MTGAPVVIDGEIAISGRAIDLIRQRDPDMALKVTARRRSEFGLPEMNTRPWRGMLYVSLK